ncbi:MAG TPA: class I SAM-dependent methyltransferase [Actinomycetaceae bacterium]|nr:class I SAM-dependent methyltransferase [Actinomycetaceae bacterium]
MTPDYRDEFARANAGFWSGYADEYLTEHGKMLGDVRLLWCPEGVDEDAAGLLGDVAGRDVLEVGCGAAQGSRWVASRGGRATGLDLSPGMLERARQLNEDHRLAVELVQGDARELPCASESFDVVFTAFGAIPFVPDPERIFDDVARVLRPGGLWVFSTSHPMRWGFADDPDPEHLRVVRPYFDSVPYLEAEGTELRYAEFQHTFEDLVSGLTGAGFVIDRMLEPQWIQGNHHVWGSWSAARAPYVPGTLIVSSHLP